MYSVGIDLGGSSTKVAFLSPEGTILHDRRLPGFAGIPPEEAVRELRQAIEETAAGERLTYPPPLRCGIGVPGVVDHRTGFLRLSGPLGWNNVALGELAQNALGCGVEVDTDVNAGALADLHVGCARTASELLYISWGAGIGAAFVAARKLYHSRGCAMGNFGHMPADPDSARLCYCGSYGCLEIEAGGRSLVDQVRQLLAGGEPSLLCSFGEAITPETIAWASERNDLLARRLLVRAVTLIARAVAGVLAFLNPDTVVFGGGVSRCLPSVRAEFESELARRTPRFSLPSAGVLESAFSDRAGAVGAALLPLARSGTSPGG